MTTVYVTPGHPTKAGAGYDCMCGQCLYVRDKHCNSVDRSGQYCCELDNNHKGKCRQELFTGGYKFWEKEPRGD